MAGHNFDWSLISALITPTSPIPGDIQFKVVDKVGQVLANFEAHKIILALHSDHFKNAFFGSGTFFKEKDEGIVVIKETTKEAFEDFLGFNYEKKIEFEKKTLPELYEILNLAEKYQVKELKEKVVNFIKSFPLSINNVVKIAATTQEFSHFKEESEDLYKKCVTFLRKHLDGAQSILNFISKHADESMVVVKLLKDVKTSQPCSNCKQRPCRNGSNILKNDLLLPGMLVGSLSHGSQRCRVKNSYKSYWNDNVAVSLNDWTGLDYLINDGKSMFYYVCDPEVKGSK